MTEDIASLAERVLERARGLGLMIATAESCTGGLVAGALTAIAGSSDVFERGFVTYSNEAKEEMLCIDPALIAAHGAVSPEVAIAMAACALRQSRAQLSVAVTGIAGPSGGTAEKPVGLVHFAAAKALSREGEPGFRRDPSRGALRGCGPRGGARQSRSKPRCCCCCAPRNSIERR